MPTPNFIGPEGFVKLEVYSGRRVYLMTMFDDGHAVSTSPLGKANRRTEYLDATGDLRADYLAHLRAVAERVRRSGSRPLYRTTPKAFSAVWKLFPLYQVNEAMALLMLVLPALIFFALFQVARTLMR
ncbi:MAG: hypothetical protein KC776_43295 [Myxococcales bacterium]|nr:hypothetical protein [Myxococcales bacterium]MCB9582320.1 hypothetical protein [Polyangiaceae bacterium]